MFSSTVMRDSALVSWNVRTMPRRATLYAETPPSERPSNVQVPSLGLSKPVSRLKNVVFPAPFGPMSAVIAPRWTSRCSTWTATRPPKRRVTPSATRIGSGFGTPGRASRPTSPAAPVWPPPDPEGTGSGPSAETDRAASSAGIERQLLLVAEQALRPEDHQRHQQQAHEDLPDDADLVGRS